MSITQEMKNVIKEIKIETISDFGTFQELESFASELLNSNDTSNKLLALRIQNRLSENPIYQNYVNQAKIAEEQAVAQHDKEIDKRKQEVKTNNANNNYQEKKREETKLKEQERKMLENLNYKNYEALHHFIENEYQNLSPEGRKVFLDKTVESLTDDLKQNPEKAFENAKEVVGDGKAIFEPFMKIDWSAISQEERTLQLENMEKALFITDIARYSKMNTKEFTEFYFDKADAYAAGKAYDDVVNGRIEGFPKEYAKYLVKRDSKSNKVYLSDDAPEEVKRAYEYSFMAQKSKYFTEILIKNEEKLNSLGVKTDEVIKDKIKEDSKDSIEKLSSIFKDEASTQNALNSGALVKKILYSYSGVSEDKKNEIFTEAFKDLYKENESFKDLVTYHKSEIKQMLFDNHNFGTKEQPLYSVAKDDFLRELYNSDKEHTALKSFLKGTGDFGNEKSIDIIVEKLEKQYVLVDELERKAKDPKYQNDEGVKGLNDLNNKINENTINSLHFKSYDESANLLSNYYNRYFGVNEKQELIAQNERVYNNGQSLFTKEEVVQLQEVSRAEFFIKLREIVADKIKNDPEYQGKEITDVVAIQYLMKKDASFRNSEEGKKILEDSYFFNEDVRKEINDLNSNVNKQSNQAQTQAQVKEVNIYNPTVKGQNEQEGVAYEVQKEVSRTYNHGYENSNSQVFVPSSSSSSNASNDFGSNSGTSVS